MRVHSERATSRRCSSPSSANRPVAARSRRSDMFYIQRGKIPRRRHVVYRNEKGEHQFEEHISRLGFSDIYSNAYHIHMPTRVAKVGKFRPINIEAIEGD